MYVFTNFIFCQRNRRISDSPGISSDKHGDQISYTKWIHQLLWGVVECWVGVIYLYSLTKGSLESMQTESIVCNLWIQGVWNLRSIIVKHELWICWSQGLDVIASQLIMHAQRSGKGALRQFSTKNDLTAIFDTNKFMQGWDKSEVVHVWLRLLPKPDDPLTHKTIKCSLYCSCFKLTSDTFSISYHGPSLRDPKQSCCSCH